MNAKDFERFMAERGASASAVDQVVRTLRRAFKLKTSGRGMNAKKLTDGEVAWLVAAYAGSDVATKADRTLLRLMKLKSPHKTRLDLDFIGTLSFIFSERFNDIAEIRIARNVDHATIAYLDGTMETFFGGGQPFPEEFIINETIIGRKFIRDLFTALPAPQEAVTES